LDGNAKGFPEIHAAYDAVLNRGYY